MIYHIRQHTANCASFITEYIMILAFTENIKTCRIICAYMDARLTYQLFLENNS